MVRLTPFLVDGDLKDRYAAVGTILAGMAFYKGQADSWRKRGVAEEAIKNARIGLA